MPPKEKVGGKSKQIQAQKAAAKNSGKGKKKRNGPKVKSKKKSPTKWFLTRKHTINC
jgi:hypothetical protein